MSDFGDEFRLLGRDQSASVGSLMEGLLGGAGLSRKMSANQRASMAWMRANGDIERKHTTGVFLKEPANRRLPPVLGVYVDSHARLSDFNANKEIYLARLHNTGLEVSGIEFRLTRRPREKCPEPEPAQNSSPLLCEDDLPALSDDERARVEELCAGLPDGLREAATRAMSLSLRRGKSR